MGEETVARAIDRLAEATRENAKAMREWTEANRPTIATRLVLDDLLVQRTELEVQEIRARLGKAETDARVSLLMAEALERKAAE